MVMCLGLEVKDVFSYDAKLHLEGVQLHRIQSDENRQVSFGNLYQGEP